GAVGSGGNGGSRGVVVLAGQVNAQGCRSRRRPDGGGDSAVHRPGLDHWRHALRYEWLSNHLHRQRIRAVDRGRLDLPDLAGAIVARRWRTWADAGSIRRGPGLRLAWA